MKYDKLAQVLAPCQALLSTLAYSGTRDDVQVANALTRVQLSSRRPINQRFYRVMKRAWRPSIGARRPGKCGAASEEESSQGLCRLHWRRR